MDKEAQKMFDELDAPRNKKKPDSSASELNTLLDCPAGHRADTWLVDGWVMCGCKNCNHAAAAYKSFGQASHDWNAMCKVMMAN